MIVNELVTKFKFDVGNGFKNFDRKLKQTARGVDRTTKRMGRMFQSMGRDIARGMKHKLRIDGSKAAARDLKRLQGLAHGLKASLKSMVLPGGLIGALGALGVVSAAKNIFDTNVEIAKLKSAMQTAVGPSGDFAKEYQRVKDFASTTPFALQQSMEAFVKLTNLGLNPSNKALKSYGNTATAMGKDLSQMIEAVADASTMEFERLKEFGIKAKQQGDEVEFTFQGVKTKVKKDSKAIQDYLIGLGETRFGNAMADQMNSLPGVVSNVADNFTKLKLALFEGGLEKGLLPFLKGFRDFLGDLEPKVKKAGKAIGGFLRDFQVFAKVKIGPWLKELPDKLKKLERPARIAAGALFLLGLRAVGLRTIVAGQALIKGLQMAAGLLYSVGLRGFFAAAGAWAAQIAIGGIVLAIAALIIAQNEFEETGDSFLVRAAEKWAGLGDEMRNVHIMIDAVKLGFQDLDGTMAWWAENSSMYMQTLQNEYAIGFDALKTTVSNWVQIAQAKFDQFLLKGREVFPQFQDVVKAAMNIVKAAILGPFWSLGSLLDGLPARARAAFDGLVSAAISAASRMPVFGGVIGGIGSALGYNTGGMVPGGFGTRDTVPAMLTPGEVVVPVQAVKQIQAGNPAGFAKVAQLAQTKMAGASPQTYSMPASTVARGAGSSYATNINAPITQNYQISMGEGSPSAVAKAVTQRSAGSIRQELDFVARQAPRRVARA